MAPAQKTLNKLDFKPSLPKNYIVYEGIDPLECLEIIFEVIEAILAEE